MTFTDARIQLFNFYPKENLNHQKITLHYAKLKPEVNFK